ncbi:MAG: BrnT family toxin [Nitrospirae bacterium]|nr:BrnT family toxin [Nitrospirota bacterium]
MVFEWDENKNNKNIIKHGIAFKEAMEIFDDPFQSSVIDRRFGYNEERWITIGTTKKGNIIVVAHLYFIKNLTDEVIRIISARKATKKEMTDYGTIRWRRF